MNTRFGGLVLTHNEVGKAASLAFGFLMTSGIYAASDSGEGAILPTWTAVDTNNVRTQRELMEYMRKDGWNVEVRSSNSVHVQPLISSCPVSSVLFQEQRDTQGSNHHIVYLSLQSGRSRCVAEERSLSFGNIDQASSG